MSNAPRTPLSEIAEAEGLLLIADKKSFWKSKTVWLQVVALLATFFPQVRDFISGNPVEVVAALAAANVLMRFATRGAVGLTDSSGEETHGGGSWWNPLVVAMVGLGALGLAHPVLMGI